MKKYGYIYLLAATLLLGGIFLPRLYRLVTAKGARSPFTLYSCTVHKFLSLDYSDKDLGFVDEEGTHYGDTAQPMFYYRDVFAKGHMPDSIEGRKVTMEEIEKNYFFFYSTPDEITKNLPKVYFLMESSPDRVDLDDAEFAFVSRKDRLEVIRMKENKVDEDKSSEFTSALRSAGFVFPVRTAAGNPTPKKEYDEGYILTDSDGGLFHMKMTKGEPYVEAISLPDSLTVTHAFITEYPSHRTLAFVTDASYRWHVIENETLRLIPTDIIADPAVKDIMWIGDMFYITVKVSDDKGEDFTALRTSDFSTAAVMRRNAPGD